MSILNNSFVDKDFQFSDIANIIEHNWEPMLWDIGKLSDLQCTSGLIDGSGLENIWIKYNHLLWDGTFSVDDLGKMIFGQMCDWINNDAIVVIHSSYNPINKIFQFYIWDEDSHQVAFEMVVKV